MRYYRPAHVTLIGTGARNSTSTSAFPHWVLTRDITQVRLCVRIGSKSLLGGCNTAVAMSERSVVALASPPCAGTGDAASH